MWPGRKFRDLGSKSATLRGEMDSSSRSLGALKSELSIFHDGFSDAKCLTAPIFILKLSTMAREDSSDGPVTFRVPNAWNGLPVLSFPEARGGLITITLRPERVICIFFSLC